MAYSMLYSCTNMAIVGVKRLTSNFKLHISFDCRCTFLS